MKAAVSAWKRAFGLAWSNMTGVVMLNVLWMVCSWLVVTVGPATLSAYWWAAHVIRDEQEQRPVAFFHAMKRFFWRGLLWEVCWVVIFLLAYSNLVVYGQWLAPLPAAIVRFLWAYALIFLVAMQPYLLEMLTMEDRPFLDAVKRSAWQVAANPIYSHIHLLVPVIAAFVAWRTTTLAATLLVALALIWWAVAAADLPWKYGEKRRHEVNIEDVL
ncbi:MAG TPA: YesL family protein [Symbiobacteriaceae bacterium]|nr:YesL family protein [Symbiobacteriaceae bacterium]